MAASQLPQELIDTIINNVEDEWSLHSCSRVALSWVTSSQRLLFHFISLAPSRYKSSSHSDLISRLRNAFDTSPHLARHVRILELDPSQVVPSQTEPLFALLSRLEEVRVVDFEDAPMFTCPQHHPFHSLLALTSVTRLTIGPGAWYLGDVMPCLRSGQNLTELTLEDVIFEGYGYGVCSRPCLPGIELEQLTIRRGFVGLLAELNGIPGMDLSRLKRLSVLLGVRNAQTTMRWRNRAPIFAMSDVLKANHGMLEHLSLDVFLDQPLCDLFNVSRLRSLSVHVRWYLAERNPVRWLTWINASLEGMTGPSVMEEFLLRVTTYADDDVPDLSGECGRLDKLLSRSNFGSLSGVVIEQDGEGVPPLTKDCFPQLTSKGVAITWC